MPIDIGSLRFQRKNILNTLNAISSTAQAENRGLFTDDEQSRWDENWAQLNAIDERIGQVVGQEQRAGQQNNAWGQLTGTPVTGPGYDHDRPDGPLPLLPGREQLAEIRGAMAAGRSERFTVAPEETRAVVTTALAGVPAQAMTRRFMEPRRLATAARLGTQRVSGIESAVFPIFGAGSAEITAEGVLKQEYSAITPGSAVPQMINVWTDFTRQLDMSMGGFETRLRSKLAALVAAREDKLLIATALGLTLPTFAKAVGVARSDALLQAAATVLGAVGMAPNVAVVNTADVPGIFTGSTGAGGESPEEELRLAVRGMVVYPSPDIASGTALVGAWPAGASLVVGLDPTYLVDAVSGIKNNKITLLLEEAVALAVDDTSAFVKITTFTN